MDLVTRGSASDRYRNILVDLYGEMQAQDRINGLWLISRDVQTVIYSMLNYKNELYFSRVDTLNKGESLIAMLLGLPVAMPATVAESYIALCNTKTGYLLEVF